MSGFCTYERREFVQAIEWDESPETVKALKDIFNRYENLVFCSTDSKSLFIMTEEQGPLGVKKGQMILDVTSYSYPVVMEKGVFEGLFQHSF